LEAEIEIFSSFFTFVMATGDLTFLEKMLQLVESQIADSGKGAVPGEDIMLHRSNHTKCREGF